MQPDPEAIAGFYDHGYLRPTCTRIEKDDNKKSLVEESVVCREDSHLVNPKIGNTLFPSFSLTLSRC